ncbi:excalibur calcium-binding domain-containing protein [Microvirga sp. M2]|uniref:excalibur calcium-binding domain-containing protein n=1 Tax=Microvirga sp. M2 TaxID=3073270 RepID=UPI0039C0AC57
MRTFAVVVLAAVVASGIGLSAEASSQRAKEWLMARGGTCKSVSTCEEAVELWCGGYSRADGDGDGIPCENVCRSKSQVDAIKQRVGC